MSHEVVRILDVGGDEAALADLVRGSRSEGTLLRLVALRTEGAEGRLLARRRHDVASATRTIRFVLEALKGGYRFDDAMADAKLQAFEKALSALDVEADFLQRLFTP